LIDETKYPFNFDHSKCFNCQLVPNLSKEERDGNRDGSSWQKGVHLCTSCQWHCAMLALETKVDNIIKRELSRIEGIHGIYFDEVTPQEVIEKLEKEKSQRDVKDEEIEKSIKDLKQIIRLGFNKLKLVC
jgi:hypothetical protein